MDKLAYFIFENELQIILPHSSQREKLQPWAKIFDTLTSWITSRSNARTEPTLKAHTN